ncbi:fatty acid desaturase [Aliidongia dinghuensis]|uniref:Fatty acid desaturase n=1 Tax=Aliidongia dinghuensis TaxID=1867774 RepID=A0A8J3E6V2_9PROT|nr:fatty acid desaturase [Aliidongia dinghuensis]GGF48250.1 fatty acid desaturase [Aliidongia dinghuensis]
MTPNDPSGDERDALRRSTRAFERPTLGRSLWQMANSFLPFLATCALMYWTLTFSPLLTAALGVAAAGFLVRIFIIQHDCGHGSFFRSRAANNAVGTLCSLVTFTPYLMWRRQHAGHHSHWNNLDRRLSGTDIYSGCLTLAEYQALPGTQRRLYRVMQHPVVSWLVLPPLVFTLLYRLPFDAPRSWRRERWAVQLTNLALLALYLGLGFALGFRTVLLVQGPVLALGAIVGVWLFSVQHRFEDALWTRQPAWHPVSASIEGSSYLELPALLQWFTGNIGFHHVHHLNPRIPNYRLEACHDATPALQTAFVMKPWHALKSWRAALWDEGTARMVPIPKSVPLFAEADTVSDRVG